GASLDARTMSPELVVEVVGLDGLAEHAPVSVLWACVASALERPGDGESARQPRAATVPTAVPAPASAPASASRATASNGAPVEPARTGAAAPADEADPPRKPNRSARLRPAPATEPAATVPRSSRP